MSDFIPKRPQYYWIEKVYTEIIIKMLPVLKNSFITPNMITSVNLFLTFPLLCICAFTEKYIACAFLIQLYLFIDIMDGNLARYKNMCSDFGKKMDKITDILFYTIFYILLGYKVGLSVFMIIFFIFTFHFYGIIATFYIVPRLKKIKDFKRWGLKKMLFERGIIFGMDNGMQNVMMSLFLFTSYKKFPFYLSIILYLTDLCYRIYELKRNEKLNSMDGVLL